MIETLRKGPRCGVCLLLETLRGEDLAGLQRVLADPLAMSTSISRALIASGHAVRPQALQRHRRGECLGPL